MVIDTSAVLALIRNEATAPDVLHALQSRQSLLMSTATYVELFLVLDNAGDPAAAGRVDDLLAMLDVDMVDVTREQALVARQAHRDFGRGNHRAKLNFGDCFSYALAKVRKEPLLFVGGDFGFTDVRPVLE
ncbi:MAG: type II toxin-antitoxin system VapC family toxin [Candidatus Nanopelagicales bacterium]